MKFKSFPILLYAAATCETRVTIVVHIHFKTRVRINDSHSSDRQEGSHRDFTEVILHIFWQERMVVPTRSNVIIKDRAYWI